MILVTGGTGFVGQEVVKQLANAGYPVRLLVRNPDRARALFRSLPVEIVPGDVLDPASLASAVRGTRAVVHLVGIINELFSTYERIHVDGTRNVVEAAKAAGVRRFLHMSAINTRPHAPSRYHQTKWQAEEIVRSAGLEWTIFRPSVIYGEKDLFTNAIASLTRFPLNLLTLFSLPCPGDGETRMQPVSVRDVALCFRRALANEQAVGKVYELGGDPITLENMMLAVSRALGQKPAVVNTSLPGSLFLAPALLVLGNAPLILPLPSALVKFAAYFFGVLSPLPLVNYDLALMIEEDQHADSSPARRDLGFDPGNFSENIRSYLRA